MALIHFQLRKLEQTGRNCRKLRSLLAQSRVSARGGVAAAGPEFGPGEIPLGQRTPRLRGIVRPTAELLARGLALGAIKLVELFEDCRQCRVRRVMFDEILEWIVTNLRRLQLQMRIRHRTQRCDQHRPARAFRPAQDRLVKLDRVLVMIQLRLEAALQITLLLFVAERRRPRFVENAAGAGVIAFVEEQFDRTQLSAVVPNRIA